MILPFRREGEMQLEDYTAATNIAKKDFMPGTTKIDRALTGQVAGLQVKRSSGMPGEGSYYNLRGIRTLTGDNAPLIVINGVPHMPDKTPSALIDGFTRDIFQFYHLQDIQNITILKGAEAAMYGSMGSNGVILIETDGTASNDLETRVSYYGSYGINWNDKRMPVMGLDDYKQYLADMGMTISKDPQNFYNNFPFMQNPNDPRYNYLYNNNTDWQDLIYKNTASTDHLFRVEGGDNIAKYDLSLGYYRENGLMDNTSMERFHTLLNANVLVNKQLNIFATVGLAYMNGHYQMQGMDITTNPILAAYARSIRIHIPFLTEVTKLLYILRVVTPPFHMIPPSVGMIIDKVKELETVNTDWFKYLFRNAITHRHSLSISGGNEKTTFYVSGSYMDEQHTAKEVGQQVYTGLVKVNTYLRENIRLGASLNASMRDNKSFFAVDSWENPYEWAIYTTRAQKAYDENGDYNYMYYNGVKYN